MLIESHKELSNKIWEYCNFEDDYNVRYAISTGTWGKKFLNMLDAISDGVGSENRAIILNDLNEDGFSIVSRIAKYGSFIGYDLAIDIIDKLLEMGASPVASAQCLSALSDAPVAIFDKFLFLLDEADFNGCPIVIPGHDGNPFHDTNFLFGYIFWSVPPTKKEDIKSSKKWLGERRSSDYALPTQIMYEEHINMLKENGITARPVVSNLVLDFLVDHLDSIDANGIALWNRLDKDMSDGTLIPGINLPIKVAALIEERKLEGQTQTVGSKLRKPHRL